MDTLPQQSTNLPAFSRNLKDVDNYFILMKLTEDNIRIDLGGELFPFIYNILLDLPHTGEISWDFSAVIGQVSSAQKMTLLPIKI